MLSQETAPTQPAIFHSVFAPPFLAELVRAQYGLGAAVDCRLWAAGVNELYLVTNQTQRFMLRITRAHHFGDFDEPAYRYELDLLRFLGDASVPVAGPVARTNGDLLGWLAAAEGQRYYTLFPYLEGAIPDAANEEQSMLLGQALARFHHTTRHFSSAHTRQPLDEVALIDKPLQRIRQFPQLLEADVTFLEQLASALRQRLLGLARTPDIFGIVHGDFWWRNTHLKNKQVALFDFEFCAPGWWIYDIGTILMSARALDYPLSAEVFLQSYQSVRPLQTIEVELLPSFICLRAFWGLGFWTSLADIVGAPWYYSMFSRMVKNLRNWVSEDSI